MHPDPVSAQAVAQFSVRLVEHAFHYVGGEVDDVFVYASCEDGLYVFDAFFGAGRRLWRADRVAHASTRSVPQGSDDAWQFLVDGARIVREHGEWFSREGMQVPTEVRVIGSVHTHYVQARVRYEPVWSGPGARTPGQVFAEWFAAAQHSYAGPV